jgi:hypothetical protein
MTERTEMALRPDLFSIRTALIRLLSLTTPQTVDP